MPNEIQSWLDKQAGAWAGESEKAKNSKFDKLPEGRYIGVLTSAEVGVSRNERPQVAWGYTIIEGDLAGEKVRAYDGLDQEDSLYYLGRRFGSMGVDPTTIDLKKLQKHLDALVEQKLTLKIRLKNSKDGEFQNIYIDGVVSGGSETSAPTEPVVDMSQVASEGEPEVVEEVVEVVEEVVEDVAEEEVTLAVGMTVQFEWQGETLQGVAAELLDTKAKIKVGDKLYPVAYDKLALVETELDK